MNIKISNTGSFVKVDGKRFEHWIGETGTGVEVDVFVYRVQPIAIQDLDRLHRERYGVSIDEMKAAGDRAG